MEYLNMKQAAKYLGVTIQRVQVLAKQGRIGTQMAGHWLFTKEDLDRYDQERRGRKGGPRPRK